MEPPMTDTSKNKLVNSTADEYTLDIPIDISDILTVCREYSQLGWQMQQQLEYVMEVGIEEAISSGKVNANVIPLMRDFLRVICQNAFFGDASDQSYQAIMMLDDYVAKHPFLFGGTKN